MNKNLTPNADLAGTVSVNKICNRYIIDVLENNWNEERFDIEYLKTDKPLQSNVCFENGSSSKSLKILILNLLIFKFQHYYDTTYSDYERKYGIKNLDPKLILAKSKHFPLLSGPAYQEQVLSNIFA